MPDPLLDVRAIDVFYDDFQALFGVSLRVNVSEVVAVIGANGAGKSTLLKTIAGLMHPRAAKSSSTARPLELLPHSLSSSAASRWCRKAAACFPRCRSRKTC
jgi:ABC-type branched-subunit amino acid transport system ATPase component